MEILSRSSAQYRTQLMEQARAETFRRCLLANAAFAFVDVQQSSRAKSSAKFFVTFEPSSGTKRQAILDRQQDARADRAQDEGRSYLWVQDADEHFWWVFNPASMQTYEVRPQLGLCACPDHTYRCAGNGIQCKHVIAFHAGLGHFHPAVMDAANAETEFPFGLPEPERDSEWDELLAARAQGEAEPEEWWAHGEANGWPGLLR